MSLPRYPEYKDSGVEWLGQVPAHWVMDRLKRRCHVFPSNVDKKSVESEKAVRLCNYTDVYYNDRISSETSFMEATASDEQIAKFTLKAGDTVFTKDSETASDIGVAAFVPDDLPGTVCGYHLSIARPLAGASGAYVKRLFDAHYTKARFAVLANGLTRVGLNQYAVDNVELPWPPFEEQAVIAGFLDRETARIDALIAEQEKLLALLAEKRQATISHAVTRGLDANVPMKDSGIAWLGEVPAHWGTSRLKHVTDAIFDCPHSTPIYDGDGDYLVIRTADLDRGVLIKERMYRLVQSEYEERTRRSALKEGDIVYGREGERWGHAALVPESDRYCLGQRMMQFRPSAGNCPGFLMWQLNSVGIYRQGELDTVGATSPHVNVSTIRNFELSVPPLEEQKAIASFLEAKASNFDSMGAEARRAIDILRERRSALITAAVTGQIDARGLVEEDAD